MGKKPVDVLVISGGKCGSTTLMMTMRDNGFKCEKYHNTKSFKIRNKEGDLYSFVEECCKDKTIFIIDSYRLPIERKISSFFHNLNSHLPEYKEFSIEELITFFNEKKVMYLEEGHSINYLQNHFKFPRFKSFDFEKRYNIYEQDNKILIKILFRDIGNWDKILSEIFNKEIVITSANVSKNKDYYDLYMEFLDKYKVPKRYLEKVLSKDTEFKIYNTPEEQENYIKKWEARSI